MKILLFGKDGQVGRELQRTLAVLGEVHALGRHQANLENAEQLRHIVRDMQPSVIVNAAAYTAVDMAESEPEKAHRINCHAPGVLAEEAGRLNAWLVHYSTDYIFDGEKSDAYTEEDEPNPLSTYGKSKLQAEETIRQSVPTHLVFRTSWVYGAHGKNFIKTMLRLAREKEELKVVADQHGAPTSAELIADITSLVLHEVMHGDAARRELAGTYHLAASGETNWHEYARHVLTAAQARGVVLRACPEAVLPITSKAYAAAAARPKNSRLRTDKLRSTFNVHLPDWQYHVELLLDELFARDTI